MAYERQTAYNIDCKEILDGEYVKGQGFEPNFVKTSFGLIANRAMIAGVVVETKEQEISIDDKTGIIKVRSYEPFLPFEDIKNTDTVIIIGKIREYGNEKYLAPEICTKITIEDVEYFNVNKKKIKELFLQKKIIQIKQETSFSDGKELIKEIVEEKIEENKQDNVLQKILTYIDEEDKGKGVEKVKLLDVFPSEETLEILDTLILEGDIFEIKPGVFKVLK